MTKECVFVTGAGGFVGMATIKKLLKEGHCVRAFELTSSPYVGPLNALAYEHDDLTVITGDITNKSDIRAAIGNSNYVIHSAALLNSIAPKHLFHNINVTGARNMMEIALEADVKRFLLVSTSDVFGIPNKGETISETTPYREWLEPYADTKIEACKLLKDFSKSGLDYTIIYPGWVYGPGDRQFFPAIIDMLKDKHVFLWHKDDPYEIDFIYIDDLVEGITNALFNEAAKNEDFLILDDRAEMTPEDVFKWMARHLGLPITIHKLPYSLMMLIAQASQWLCRKGITKTHLLSTTDVKAFGNDFRFTSNKARELLNWEPATTELEGIEAFFEWHKTNS